MKIKIFSSIWIAIFLAVTLWNILCLVGMIPLTLRMLSFLLIILGNSANALIICYLPKKNKEPENKMHPLFTVFLCCGISWIATYIACTVYST